MRVMFGRGEIVHILGSPRVLFQLESEIILGLKDQNGIERTAVKEYLLVCPARHGYTQG